MTLRAVATSGSSPTAITGTGSSGQVAIFTGAQTIGGDADLTFSGSRLTATDLTVTSAPTFSAMTAARVHFSGTAGLLADSASLTFGASLVNSLTGLKVGAGSGTDYGVQFGTHSSNLGAIWAGGVVASTSNWAIALDANTQVNGTVVNLLSAGGNRLSVSSAGVNLGTSLRLAFGNTAPTLASGGCTSPTAVTSSGTHRFSVGVGTGCSGSQPLVFTLPAATTGWNCYAQNSSNAASSVAAQSSAISTTSVTITSYSRTLGTAQAWVDGDVVVVSCLGG